MTLLVRVKEKIFLEIENDPMAPWKHWPKSLKKRLVGRYRVIKGLGSSWTNFPQHILHKWPQQIFLSAIFKHHQQHIFLPNVMISRSCCCIRCRAFLKTFPLTYKRVSHIYTKLMLLIQEHHIHLPGARLNQRSTWMILPGVLHHAASGTSSLTAQSRCKSTPGSAHVP